MVALNRAAAPFFALQLDLKAIPTWGCDAPNSVAQDAKGPTPPDLSLDDVDGNGRLGSFQQTRMAVGFWTGWTGWTASLTSNLFSARENRLRMRSVHSWRLSRRWSVVSINSRRVWGKRRAKPLFLSLSGGRAAGRCACAHASIKAESSPSRTN